MTLINWDHTMINVPNLKESIDFFADEGIIFKLGGRHENWGTANALGYFGINYIELINVFNQQKAGLVSRASSAAVYDVVQDFNQHKKRFNTVAIRTDDLESIRQRLKLLGIAAGPILEGKRLNEKNQLITWRIFFIDDDIDGLPYPFFIDWENSDADRERQLVAQGLIQQHPAGDLNVVKAVFEVSNPVQVSQQWAKIINSTVIDDHGKFIVPIGEKAFEFIGGTANHLSALHFSGAHAQKRQRTISFGEAQFIFD